jgi:Leucine-rich repeat (LRR) protein
MDNLVINAPNYRFASTNGNHNDGNTNLEVEYVWLKNGKIKYLPLFNAQVFFPNIRKYLVTDSMLENVKREDFSGFPKMETLNLSGNKITTLPEDTLYDLGALVDFFIENNNLVALPQFLLNNAPLFQRFRASNNSVEVLELAFFRNNNALKIFSMDNNKLKTIKIDFRPYKNLKKIDLLGNVCINTSFNDWRKSGSIDAVQSDIGRNCK